MIQEQLLKVHKQLLAYNHIYMISENKQLPLKSQKDLWVKIWALKERKIRYNHFKRQYKNLNIQILALYLNSYN